MTHEEAVQFLQKGIKPESGTWLDLGAGSGAFTLAVADLLPFPSTIYAIDKDQSVLNISHPKSTNKIISVQTDFDNLPELPKLDGILMANALHYVKNPIPFLQNLLTNLRLGGGFVLIEYDISVSNHWVPYPINFKKWQSISSAVGLTDPELFNERISIYQRGRIYGALSHLV
jgi:ubiquinone/menaquinone biosynthesis C-methylase UbiE